MANVKIRLIVDTEKLSKISKKQAKKLKKEQINEICWIIDNTKDAPKVPGNPEKYFTKVDQAQTIEWSGIPKNPNIFDQVSIDSITYLDSKPKKGEKEKDLFGVPYLNGLNGTIYGTIIAKGFCSKDEETYRINVTVVKADGKSLTFSVDPQIRVNN